MFHFPWNGTPFVRNGSILGVMVSMRRIFGGAPPPSTRRDGELHRLVGLRAVQRAHRYASGSLLPANRLRFCADLRIGCAAGGGGPFEVEGGLTVALAGAGRDDAAVRQYAPPVLCAHTVCDAADSQSHPRGPFHVCLLSQPNSFSLPPPRPRSLAFVSRAVSVSRAV